MHFTLTNPPLHDEFEATDDQPQPEKLPNENSQEIKRARWVMQMLTEYFGDARQAIDFMRGHAGATVVIPIMPIIEKLAFERQIVREVHRDPSAQAANRLAAVHNVERRFISILVRKKTGVGVRQRQEARAGCVTKPPYPDATPTPVQSDVPSLQAVEEPPACDIAAPTPPPVENDALTAAPAVIVTLAKPITKHRARHKQIEVGDRFGMLVVMAPAAPISYTNRGMTCVLRRWECQCDCGRVRPAMREDSLRRAMSCGCQRNSIRNAEIHVGHKVGLLEVVRPGPPTFTRWGKCSWWWVQCSCGSAEKLVRNGNLQRRATTSCGCKPREKRTQKTKSQTVEGKLQPRANVLPPVRQDEVMVFAVEEQQHQAIAAQPDVEDRDACEW